MTTAPPPEREGVGWNPPTEERVDFIMALAEDFRAANKTQYRETRVALRDFLIEMVTNLTDALTDALTAPPPAPVTGEVVEQVMELAERYCTARRSWLDMLDNGSSHEVIERNYRSSQAVLRASIEAALARPAARDEASS